jgi:hypothetical protein
MKVSFTVLLALPWAVFGVDCESGETCAAEHDETSLVQVKQKVHPGNHRSEGSEAAGPRHHHHSYKQTHSVTLADDMDDEMPVTFVSTVGGSKWYFWFRPSLDSYRERAEENAAVYSGGCGYSCRNWRWQRWGGSSALPYTWRNQCGVPWRVVWSNGLDNGRRWRVVGNRYGSASPFYGWEVAAALPYDPTDKLELNPTTEDVKRVHAEMKASKQKADLMSGSPSDDLMEEVSQKMVDRPDDKPDVKSEHSKITENHQAVSHKHAAKKAAAPSSSKTSKEKPKTFVGTIGAGRHSRRWYFWFRQRQLDREVAEDQAIADVDADEAADDDIYAADIDDDYYRYRPVVVDDALPPLYTQRCYEPLPTVWNRAVSNGAYWRSLDDDVYYDDCMYGDGYYDDCDRPSWRDNYEIAAALPYDPLDDLDLHSVKPSKSDVKQLERQLETAIIHAKTHGKTGAKALHKDASAQEQLHSKAQESVVHAVVHSAHAMPKTLPKSGQKQGDQPVTFIATVGGSKYYLWFREKGKSSSSAAAGAKSGTKSGTGWIYSGYPYGSGYYENYNSYDPYYNDYYYDGGLPWRWCPWDRTYATWDWPDRCSYSWDYAWNRGLANGERWRDRAYGLDYPYSCWRDRWEVAAALPVDPLGDLDMYPSFFEIASTEDDIESAGAARDRYRASKAVANVASARATAANRVAGLK